MIKTIIILENRYSSQAWVHCFNNKNESIEHIIKECSNHSVDGNYNIITNNDYTYKISYLDKLNNKTYCAIYFNTIN